MSFNKESNGFIITFVVIMVVLVSLSLSLISSGLKPLKDKNEIVDKKIKILKSVINVDEKEEKKLFTSEFVLQEYENKIEEVVVDYLGNVKEGLSAFEIDFKKETRKPQEERSYPVFIYQSGGEKHYIIPLIGMGLWDEISGYLSLKEDFNTIQGTAFDHKAETPGLGAKIADHWFRQQFQDKQLYDEQNNYALRILKGEGHKEVKTNKHVVDGMSGATLTAQGTDVMIEKSVKLYSPFFEKVKS